MLNALFALFVSVSSSVPASLPTKVEAVAPAFQDCVSRGGEVYSLSDGSHVCEE